MNSPTIVLTLSKLIQSQEISSEGFCRLEDLVSSDAKGTCGCLDCLEGSLVFWTALDSSFNSGGRLVFLQGACIMPRGWGTNSAKEFLQWAVNSRDKGAAVRVGQFLGNFCTYGHIRNNFLDRRERLMRFFWINCYRGQFWKTAARLVFISEPFVTKYIYLVAGVPENLILWMDFLLIDIDGGSEVTTVKQEIVAMANDAELPVPTKKPSKTRRHIPTSNNQMRVRPPPLCQQSQSSSGGSSKMTSTSLDSRKQQLGSGPWRPSSRQKTATKAKDESTIRDKGGPQLQQKRVDNRGYEQREDNRGSSNRHVSRKPLLSSKPPIKQQPTKYPSTVQQQK
ncbi:hypothetical protein LXL04_001752 [Taraxacum kok-saghyz]